MGRCSDRERKIFSDPRKIHPINHQGQFFSVPGIHLCEPSRSARRCCIRRGVQPRQTVRRRPCAECVFVAAPSKVLLKKTVADIRRRAAEAGRDPHSILIFNLQTVIVGDTDREAQAKWQEYKRTSAMKARWRCSPAGRGSISASISRIRC